MSDTTSNQTIRPKRKQSVQSKVWITVSLLVSACIITWTFSLPFRLASSASQSELQRAEQAGQIQQKRTRAEERRQEAFADHEQFLRLISIEQESASPKPGHLESRRHWENRVAKVKKQLQELGNPETGTLQWRQKQDLLDSLEDGPQ